MTGAFELWRTGLARILDFLGVTLLVCLWWPVVFGDSQAFETAALWLGGIGALACWLAPGAQRGLPLPLLAYVGIAVLSALVHQWPTVSSTADTSWWALLMPALHLITMALFVFGAAHLLRSPWRLSLGVVLLVASVSIIGAQILFDRASTSFIYIRGGSVSLPSVSQWGGLHQTGMLLAVSFPFPLAMALSSRSLWRVAAGVLLAAAYFVTALVNGSIGGIVTMVFVGGAMAACVAAMRLSGWFRVGVPASLLVGTAGFFFAVTSGRIAALANGDLAGRVPIWRAATAIGWDHFWLGVGPGRYSAEMAANYAERYLPSGSSAGVEQAHNMLLQTAAETGVPAVLCLVVWWLCMFRSCWSAWVKGYFPLVTLGLLFALFSFFVRSMTDNLLDGLTTADRTRVLVWSIFAAALAVSRLSLSQARRRA